MRLCFLTCTKFHPIRDSAMIDVTVVHTPPKTIRCVGPYFIASQKALSPFALSHWREQEQKQHSITKNNYQCRKLKFSTINIDNAPPAPKNFFKKLTANSGHIL